MGEAWLPGRATAAQRRDALGGAKSSRRWNAAREAIFFAELAETANVRHAAERAGMTPSSAHARRRVNPAFAAAWMKALTDGYTRLETLMLDHALNGFDRTETVRGADGEVRQIKQTHSFPHAIAMRLLQSHRAAAEKFRAMEAMREGGDPQLLAKIRAEMARVRARLVEGGLLAAEGDRTAGAEPMKRIGPVALSGATDPEGEADG